ncbi:hypothetical protein THAR02_01708 [Trichoderma harzianum]|uniref:Lactam utilization protein lamB n=1 Tax=Trichoderma harzianum TaxID=5544 RepID=A0A0F9XNU8_TRIHA|nr:hypothetical protein THAR02_01708 [Trichoderma harzianum]
MPRIQQPAKINVDLGEAFGNWKMGPDDELLPLIDHANVACGFHGDPVTMMETIRKAKKYGVKVGAHPGLPDLVGFGRRVMDITPDEAYAITVYQVNALKGFLEAEGMTLHHVKPHGVFYAMMMKNYDIALAVCRAIPKGVPIFLHTDTLTEKAAKELGVPYIAETCVDIRYGNGGVPVVNRRMSPWKKEEIQYNINNVMENCQVDTVEGGKYDFPLANHEVTICAHSDTPGALEVVKAMRESVDEFNAKYFPDFKRNSSI